MVIAGLKLPADFILPVWNSKGRDFAGARDVSAENSLLTNARFFFFFFAVADCLGLCLSVSAQQTPPEQLPFDGTTLDRPCWVRTPSLTLEDQERFFFSTAFGSMRTTEDFLPAYSPWEPQSVDLPNALAAEIRSITSWIFGRQTVFISAEKWAFFTENPAANMVARIFRPTLSVPWGMRNSPSQPVISIRNRADACRAGAVSAAARLRGLSVLCGKTIPASPSRTGIQVRMKKNLLFREQILL